MEELIGKTISHYHITDRLGEGGMAIVYKAFDTCLEREVALKIIRTDVERDPGKQEQVQQRFTREAQKTAQLLHPNIIPVTDYGTYAPMGGSAQEMPYLVMPFVPGGTLKELLDRQSGPMDYCKAARVLLPVARALAYAHKVGVVHRDIKPSNILVTQSGEPMVTDFGVARILDVEQHTLETLTTPGSTVGTPEYMAPEQWRGEKMDGRVDVWALGVIFYEMVTGRRPFEADTVPAVMVKALTDPLPRPRELVKGLSETVEKVLFTALARDLKGRYKDMGAFAAALEKLSVGKSGRPGWLMPVVVGGVVLLGLISAYLMGLLPGQPSEERSDPQQDAYTPVGVIDNVVISSTPGIVDVTGTPTSSAVVLDLMKTPKPDPTTTPTSAVNPFSLQAADLLVPGEKILFLEDFQDGKETFADLIGDWQIIDDPLQPGNKVFQVNASSLDGVSRVELGILESDYIVEYKVRFYQHSFPDNGRNFLSFSWRDGWNYVLYLPSSQIYALDRYEGTEFFRGDMVIEADRWYTMRLEVKGETADFYLDGKQLSRYNPVKSELSGLYFIIGEGSELVHLDDIVVIAPASAESTPQAANTPTFTVTPPSSSEDTLVLDEDFEDGIPNGFSSCNGNWEVIATGDGNLVLESTKSTSSIGPWNCVDFGPSGLSNGIVEFRIQYVDYDLSTDIGGKVMLQFRTAYWGANNYSLDIAPYYNSMNIAYNNGSWDSLGWSNFSVERGKWYTFRVEMTGQKLTVFLDDAKVIIAYDERLTKGKLLFVIDQEATFYFDDIKVWSEAP
jgi:serine/threonine protein kinase